MKNPSQKQKVTKCFLLSRLLNINPNNFFFVGFCEKQSICAITATGLGGPMNICTIYALNLIALDMLKCV